MDYQDYTQHRRVVDEVRRALMDRISFRKGLGLDPDPADVRQLGNAEMQLCQLDSLYELSRKVTN